MLGPVLEGGAAELLLDWRPVSHFIAVRFLFDSTLEKRTERGGSLKHTPKRAVHCRTFVFLLFAGFSFWLVPLVICLNDNGTMLF